MMKAFFKKYGWQYIPGIAFLLLSAYIQIQSPRLLGSIIDALSADRIDRLLVYRLVLMMLAVALLAFGTRFLYRELINGNGRNLEAYLRQTLFSHFQKMGVYFYTRSKTGDLMAYAINDINAVRQTFGPAVAMLLNGIAITAAAIANMASGISGPLAGFALIPVPLVAVLMVFMGKEVRARFRRVQESFAAITDRTQENISGLRVIKAYVQEDAEVERFQALNRASRDANLNMVKVSASMTPAVDLLFGVSFTISLIYGSALVRGGTITLGEFVAFNGYLTMIVQPVRSISRIVNVFSRGMASLKRLNGILNTPQEIEDGPGAPEGLNHAEVSVEGLSYQYEGDERYALKDVDLRLHPGKSLGILGRTGSGKTTLANMLVRLFEVPPGTIRISGVDIAEFTLDQLRRPIGYVPQDNFLFSATIADNIRFFSGGFSDKEVEEAAEKAAVLKDILEFPKGFDTQVGERGMSLSGGQKQRICIARAMILKPALLILDDSLSAVDSRTEATILSNLKEQTQRGGSLVIVAHRISALKHMDEIIVLNQGRIAERGTHDALMEMDGFYAAVARDQMEGGDDA